ncbi:MAG: hypothetical protein GTO22_23810, partial [Gemmatimonadales bacterium]|nr:hypothetical protein [Gemmatimonadales bacterium]
MHHPEYVLHRHKGNPLLGPSDFPGADAVFNPGQTMCNGKTILLVSVDCPDRGRPQTHVAESDDGVHFTVREEPFIDGWDRPPFDICLWSPIDARITKIGDT